MPDKDKVSFECVNCRRAVRAPAEWAGKRARCPACGAENVVPSGSGDFASSIAQAPASREKQEAQTPIKARKKASMSDQGNQDQRRSDSRGSTDGDRGASIAVQFERNLMTYLKRDTLWGKYVTFRGDITDRLTEKIRQYIAPGLSTDEQPIAFLQTSSRLGHGGLLFTDTAVYWRDTENLPQRRKYEDIDHISTGQAEWYEDHEIHITGASINIPSSYSLSVTLIVACLQDAIGQTPEIPLADLRAQLDKKWGPAARIRSCLLLVLIIGVIAAFVANPRLLAPIGIGFMALCHSSGRHWHPFIVLTDIIVWIVLTCMIFSWIIEGF